MRRRGLIGAAVLAAEAVPAREPGRPARIGFVASVTLPQSLLLQADEVVE